MLYRWCFSCGHQSMEALWLEFREITFYHYNLSISSQMAVHLRSKCCFSKLSSYCEFTRAFFSPGRLFTSLSTFHESLWRIWVPTLHMHSAATFSVATDWSVKLVICLSSKIWTETWTWNLIGNPASAASSPLSWIPRASTVDNSEVHDCCFGAAWIPLKTFVSSQKN